jgi:hypothetical protein
MVLFLEHGSEEKTSSFPERGSNNLPAGALTLWRSSFSKEKGAKVELPSA